MSATPEQAYLIKRFEDARFDFVFMALTRMKLAHDAIVSLPCTGADGGPVYHRDNLQMHGLKDIYRNQALTVWNHLTDKEQSLITKEFKGWQNLFY